MPQFFFILQDFWQMVVHHIVTVLLLIFSYYSGFFRIGSIIVLLHDLADIFLEVGSAGCHQPNKDWLYFSMESRLYYQLLFRALCGGDQRLSPVGWWKLSLMEVACPLGTHTAGFTIQGTLVWARTLPPGRLLASHWKLAVEKAGMFSHRIIRY